MRATLVKLHGYVGLSVALFLVVAGLTGSILAFQTEIEGWLNPRLFTVEQPGRTLPLTTLVSRIEAAVPGASVRGIALPNDQHVYPIHSGQIAGLPGRILICLSGLVVAMLSVTGIIVWWKKRAPRVVARQKARVKTPSIETGAFHAAE